MKIFLGADHRGYCLKENLKSNFKSYDIIDLGASEFDKEDDYPDFATKVAEKTTENKDSRGIIICGSGIGVDIAANKINGARAGLGFEIDQVKEAVEADNINILALSADYTSPEKAEKIVKAFLSTKYVPEPRRERRLQKIQQLENK